MDKLKRSDLAEFTPDQLKSVLGILRKINDQIKVDCSEIEVS